MDRNSYYGAESASITPLEDVSEGTQDDHFHDIMPVLFSFSQSLTRPAQ